MNVRRWNPRIPFPAFCAAAALAQAILQQVFARIDVVSSLFAAGSHLPAGRLVLALVFVALRLFVFLALPGWLAARMTLRLLRRAGIQRRSDRGV